MKSFVNLFHCQFLIRSFVFNYLLSAVLRIPALLKLSPCINKVYLRFMRRKTTLPNPFLSALNYVGYRRKLEMSARMLLKTFLICRAFV